MSALSSELGFELFERSGRSIALTAKGAVLAEAVDTAFVDLERVLDGLDAQSKAFVVAIQPAMATSWVVPLLDQLETVAQTEIRLRIFERDGELDSRDWDFAIVPGDGQWSSWDSSLLFPEVVRPFCSPALAAKLSLHENSAPRDLVDKRLLHIDPIGRPNMTWHEWFAKADRPTDLAKPRLVYNAYPTVIQEAIAGNGIMLGWQHLLGDLESRRLLVPVGPIVQRERGGHHVCWQRGRADHRHAAIRTFLNDEIQTSTDSFSAPAAADIAKITPT